MRTLTAIIAGLLALGFATPSLAAMKKSVRTHMAEMKAKDPQNFAACKQLASQRGFRADSETDSGLMMFIDGCISGRQR